MPMFRARPTDVQIATSAIAGLSGSNEWLRQFANPDQPGRLVGALTRDSNNIVTGAGVVWPDGITGTFAATATANGVSTWTMTYNGSPTRTVTQPAVTRDSSGAVTSVPALTVS